MTDIRGLERAAASAFRAGDDEGVENAARALEATGEPAGVVGAYVARSRLALRALDFAAVADLAHRAEVAAGGERDLLVMPLHMQAEAARLAGDVRKARGLYERSIALNEARGDEGMQAVEHHNIAYVDKAEGRLAEAEAHLRRAIELRRTIADLCVLAFGAVAAKAGDHQRAARLLAAGHAAFTKDGDRLDPADEPEFDASVAAARAGLGDRFEEVWAAGAALPLDLAIAEAVRTA